MATDLAQKSCTPCRGGTPPLSREAAEDCRRQAPDWQLVDEATRIERTYRFHNFAQAFEFRRAGRGAGGSRGPPPRHQLRLGLCDGVAQNQEDQGPAQERLHMAAKLDRLARAPAAA